MNFKNPFLSTFKKSPLTLDRALEGRPIAARNSRLLNLPVEILSEIIRYIETDKPSLAAVAFVNSDCRQLARSCQFRDVLIDFGPRSSCILGVLIREATERMRTKDGLTRRPSLGACVRYLATNYEHYWKENRLIKPEGADENNRHLRNRWRESVGYLTTRLDHVYDPTLLLVLTTLPHLEFINWEKFGSIDRHLLESLSASKARHLKLQGSLESENYGVIEAGVSWPLLSLDIQIEWEFHFRYERNYGDSSAFWDGLFRACSSTLRILKFDFREPSSGIEAPISFTAEFSHLHHLHINFGTVLTAPSLTRLLQSPRLSTLVVDYSEQVSRDCLDSIGHLRSLDKLVLTGFSGPDTPLLRFLEYNTQLTAFAFKYEQSPTLLDRAITALKSFSNLNVLSLVWKVDMIPEPSLSSLASLTSLLQLRISAGNQEGWKRDWFVDHATIRNILAPLSNLMVIAFSRDSYRVNTTLQGRETGAYYSYRLPDEEEYARFMEQQQGSEDENGSLESLQSVWEKLHCQRMIQEAEKYAAVFPKLECIYIGQLVVFFRQSPDGKRVATLPFPERNDDFPMLETMFGIW